MSDYLEIPKALKRAVKQGKHIFVVELYHHSVDDIFSDPTRAMFRYSTSSIKWQNASYLGKLDSTPSWDKFVDKQFNSLSLSLLNVRVDANRPSFVVLNDVIKGFRVNVRVIAKGLSIADSWSVWSGRLDSISEISKEVVDLNCTQELGKFSYQIATDQYGQGCPLRFGRDDCLGTETLAEKSPLYQSNFKHFGSGGCNHTFEACFRMDNNKFYQGQRKLTTGGTFNRITFVKKANWWTLGLLKKKKRVIVPVQWSPKNQEDNSSVTIPLAFGRVSLQGRMFTSADIGGSLIGLVGFVKPSEYGIEGFYAVKSVDATFPVTSYTEHLGTLGGVGTQFPDTRFIDSGYNSRLAYLGVTCADNSEDPFADEPNEFPTISSVLKASLVPVFNGVNFDIMWTHNPVWITRYLMTNFRFTVIKDAWFNEQKNLETANNCYRIVEDDTNADIAVISDNEVENFNNGDLVRLHSASRFDARFYNPPEIVQRSGLQQRLRIDEDLVMSDGDIGFYPTLQNGGVNLQKTFLQFAFTFNGLISETSSLSDVLYGLVFPTFRGYMAFDRYAQMFIGMKQAAPNAYVRTDFVPQLDSDSGTSSNIVPITNVKKLHNKGGYLLIGAGQQNGEVRTERGIRFIHSPIRTSINIIGAMTATVTDFIAQNSAPSRAVIDFSGTPEAGNRIELKFTIPILSELEPRVLSWDWYVERNIDTATVALMFKTRLEASPTFDEFWTCEVNQINSNQLIIEYQAGFLLLNKPLLLSHEAGEEVLRVVEVYENFKDASNTDGIKDNIFDFTLSQGDDAYQTVRGVYTSAIEDFSEVEILPESAWNTIEDEREMNPLELDLRCVDGYNQAGFLVKANFIDFVVAALYANLSVPELGMFHQETDVIAVRYQTLEGAVSYLPMSVLSVRKENDSVNLRIKLYMSAMFDRRVPQEEKFLESTLTPISETTTPILVNNGGFSSTRTGDGAADAPQDINYRPKPYGVLPRRFHTDGSYSEMTDFVYERKPQIFITQESSDIIEVENFGRTESVSIDLDQKHFVPMPININFEREVEDDHASITVGWDWFHNLKLADYFEIEMKVDGELYRHFTSTLMTVQGTGLTIDSIYVYVRAWSDGYASEWTAFLIPPY